VFVSNEFNVFKDEMKHELGKGTEQVRATVDEAIPGVMREFDSLSRDVATLARRVDSNTAVGLRVLERINLFTRAVAQSFSQISEASPLAASLLADNSHGDEDQREEVSTQGAGDLHVAMEYHLVERFLCIQDMVDCWKGKGRFYDLPIPGGLEEVERRFQNKWRKRFKGAEQQRYSRFRRIVVACGDDRERIGLCEHVFKEKASVGAVVEMIQNEGWVSRNRRRRNETN
jgi:hypothetical protein